MAKPAGGKPGKKDPPVAPVDGAGDTMQALFGENFRQARVKAGLTQRDVEMQTGIKQAYISQIECGKQNPTLTTMTALALAVGKDVRAMLKPPASSAKPK